MSGDGGDEPGRIITFYSFKGGTGRTMAVANIGCLLAQQPRRRPVLLIDWDLEAPGLHRYFADQLRRSLGDVEKELSRRPGLGELFYEIKTQIDALPANVREDHEAIKGVLEKARVESYVIQTDLTNLCIMTAGRFDDGYAERMSNFPWERMFAASPPVFQCLAEILAEKFDFVLIDSRTGFTDSSGICTMLMPEILVPVFTPNRQSLDGLANIIRRAGDYRSGSNDLRPLIAYPLPSRIEASEPDLRNEWRRGKSGYQRLFEELFTQVYSLPACNLERYFDDVQVQHIPSFAYGEKIAVLSEATTDRFSLSQSYRRAADYLSQSNLPWAGEAPLADDLTATPGSAAEARRKTIQDTRLMQVETAIEKGRLKKGQRRSLLIAAALAAASFVVVTLSMAAFQTFQLLSPEPLSDERRWIAIIVSAAPMGLAVVVAVLYQLFAIEVRHRNRDQEQRENDLEAEYSRFQNKVTPYDRTDAVEILLAQVGPLLARVEAPRAGGSKFRGPPEKIFISYRREDSQWPADRLYHSLKNRIRSPKENIFIDIDDIPLGVDFASHLESKIAQCDLVLALIGPQWENAKDLSTGRRRLDDPHDFVRIELASALKKGILVVPVLLDDARMPIEDALAEDLQPLVRLNAARIRRLTFESDVDHLMRGLGL